ncbi:predicted protein, partial [Nematostella vectensis]
MSEWSSVRVSDEEPGDLVKSCPWSWRVANMLMAVFFALAAYVQINDPDPAIWITVYAIPCLLSSVVAIHFQVQGYFLWRALTVSHLCACICGALYLSTRVSVHVRNGMVHPLEHEEGRELSGLLFVIMWMALLKLVNLKSAKTIQKYLCMGAVTLSLTPFLMWGFYIK